MAERNETAAFPLVSQGGVHEHQFYQIGLSKRELIAMHMMAAYRSASPGDEAEDIASFAVLDADTLLAELAKEPKA